MINFTNTDKRWLEIIFYLVCNKVFQINNKQSDVINFINGYQWTNMYDNDILISVIQNNKILLNSDFIPSKHELLITLDHPESRLRIDTKSIKELILDTNYKYTRSTRFHAQMKYEVNPIEVYPRLNIPKIHETIYSFLLALRYIADIVKTIKF